MATSLLHPKRREDLGRVSGFKVAVRSLLAGSVATRV